MSGGGVESILIEEVHHDGQTICCTVGGDIKKHTDYAGQPYGATLCNKAAHGGGWVEYVWLAPGGSTPRRKLSYVRAVAGTPYQVGAGVYDDNTSLDALAIQSPLITD